MGDRFDDLERPLHKNEYNSRSVARTRPPGRRLPSVREVRFVGCCGLGVPYGLECYASRWWCDFHHATLPILQRPKVTAAWTHSQVVSSLPSVPAAKSHVFSIQSEAQYAGDTTKLGIFPRLPDSPWYR